MVPLEDSRQATKEYTSWVVTYKGGVVGKFCIQYNPRSAKFCIAYLRVGLSKQWCAISQNEQR